MSRDRRFDKDGQPIDLMRWVELIEDSGYRVVAYNRARDNSIVSTVWLGLDHNFSGKGPPLIFETMVFATGGVIEELEQRRTSTLEEARAVHAEILAAHGGLP